MESNSDHRSRQQKHRQQLKSNLFFRILHLRCVCTITTINCFRSGGALERSFCYWQ